MIREVNTKLFLKLTKEDWMQVGHHPSRGLLSVRNLLELYADHGERHLEQILNEEYF